MPPFLPKPAIHPGTAWFDRHAADPGSPGLEIEDTRLATFLQQFLKLAGQCRLQGPGATFREPEATWEPIFNRSILFILAEILTSPDPAYPVDQAWRRYQQASPLDPGARAAAVHELLELALAMARAGLAWEDQLAQPAVATAFPHVHDILVGHVRNLLNPNLARIDDLAWAACSHFRIRPIPLADRDATMAARFRDVLPPTEGPVLLPQDPDGIARALRDAAQSLVRASAQLRSHAHDLLQRCLQSPRHPPHVALVVAFHAMLREALAHLNRIGPRHLAHHYQDVLGLVPRPHVPDRTWLAFQAAPKSPPRVLPAGTLFLAGNSPAGRPLRYRLERDTLVQPVSLQCIAALQAIPSTANGPQPDGWITAFAQRASDDGTRPGLLPPDEPWPPFGPVHTVPVPPTTPKLNPTSPAPPPTDIARIGIDFASPVLALAQGERVLRLRLHQAPTQPQRLAPPPLTSPPSPAAPPPPTEPTEPVPWSRLLEHYAALAADEVLDLEPWLDAVATLVHECQSMDAAPPVTQATSANAPKPVSPAAPDDLPGVPDALRQLPATSADALRARRTVMDEILRGIESLNMTAAFKPEAVLDVVREALSAPPPSPQKRPVDSPRRLLRWLGIVPPAPPIPVTPSQGLALTAENRLRLINGLEAIAQLPSQVLELLSKLDQPDGSSLVIGSTHGVFAAQDLQDLAARIGIDESLNTQPSAPVESSPGAATPPLAAALLGRFMDLANRCVRLRFRDPDAVRRRMQALMEAGPIVPGTRPAARPAPAHSQGSAPLPSSPLSPLRGSLKALHASWLAVKGLRHAYDYRLSRLLERVVADADQCRLQLAELKRATPPGFPAPYLDAFADSALGRLQLLHTRVERLRTESQAASSQSQAGLEALQRFIPKVSRLAATPRSFSPPAPPNLARPPIRDSMGRDLFQVLGTLQAAVPPHANPPPGGGPVPDVPNVPNVADVATAIRNHFDLLVSAPKGWESPPREAVRVTPFHQVLLSRQPDSAPNSGIEIEMRLSPQDPALVPVSAIHTPTGGTSLLPTVRLVLRHPTLSIHRLVEAFLIQSIDIHVSVDGAVVQDIRSNEGALDPSKPFPAFGNQPAVENNLVVASAEAFAKNCDFLALQLHWHGLPTLPGGFRDYFRSYPPPTSSVPDTESPAGWSNASFAGRFSWLHDPASNPCPIPAVATHNLQPLSPEPDPAQPVPLFAWNPAPLDRNLGPLTATSRFLLIPASSPATGHAAPEPIPRIALSLQSPAEAFGLSIYPKAIASSSREAMATIIQFSKSKDGDLPKNANIVPDPPQPPFVPKLQSIQITYAARASARAGAPNRPVEARHVTPFPTGPGSTVSDNSPLPLLAPIQPGATLFLGFHAPSPPTLLSLLLVLDDDSQRPARHPSSSASEPPAPPAPRSDASPSPRVSWSIRSGDNWKSLDPTSVRDQTRGLSTTGIVSLHVGSDTSPSWQADAFVGDAPLYWLRIQVHDDAGAVPDFIKILPNAATVCAHDGFDPLADFASPLPPGSIKKPEQSIPDLAAVLQPAPSFGGRPAESTEQFHARARERIRHKDRALTPWDIEHLVLEAFPSLLAARVIPASLRHPKACPGSIVIVVVPKPCPGPASLTPRANPALVESITRHVQALAPHGSRVVVVHPTYVPLMVEAHLEIDPEYTVGILREPINEALRNALAPWLRPANPANPFSTQASETTVQHLLQSQPHVRRVSSILVVPSTQSPDATDPQRVFTTVPEPLRVPPATQPPASGPASPKVAPVPVEPTGPVFVQLTADDLPGWVPDADALFIAGIPGEDILPPPMQPVAHGTPLPTLSP